MTRAALGFRVHTGWAALVATVGPAREPDVVDRRRVEMIAGHDPGKPPFVYHAAALLALPEARRMVRAQQAIACQHARVAVSAAVEELRARGHRVVGGAIIGGNRALDSPFETILASHALIHAAEAELYRGAIADACETLKLPVTMVPANQLYAQAMKRFGGDKESLRRALTNAGRAIGKPWTLDQKESLLVALLAL
jgi:hypothetical protein